MERTKENLMVGLTEIEWAAWKDSSQVGGMVEQMVEQKVEVMASPWAV